MMPLSIPPMADLREVAHRAVKRRECHVLANTCRNCPEEALALTRE